MLPKQVRIGGVPYEVKTVDEPIVVNRRECTAAIHYDKGVIEISADMSLERQIQALWHEVMHGIVRDRFHGLEIEDEENVVEAFACGVHAFCVDNGLSFPERR